MNFGASKRTIGLRFTLLYAGAFLASGIALLVIANIFGGRSSSVQAPQLGGNEMSLWPESAQDHIRQLESQLAALETARGQQTLIGSLIALAVMAAVSLLLGRLIARRVLSPLRSITAATQRITAENLDQRLQVTGPQDEVKELSDTINELLERLETSFEAQRRFAANASHELRTPLTTIRANLDVAMAKPEPLPEPTVKLANRIGTELDRVDHLLNGLLFLARLQRGTPDDYLTLSLTALVNEAVDAGEEALTAKKLHFDRTDLEERTFTDGSEALLARAVQNLVDNAIIHSPPEGYVRIATTRSAGMVQLTVETGGETLTEEQIARLGTPFERIGTARTGSALGSGLGLSIVDAIANTHNGNLNLIARPEGGLRVVLSLPASADQEGKLE